MKQCLKFVNDKCSSPSKQDSSSGIESGSSNSGSGTNSPILFTDFTSEPVEVKQTQNGQDEKKYQNHYEKDFSKVKVLGQSINLFNHENLVSNFIFLSMDNSLF